MYYDPRVEKKASLIAYHIQTNEGIELSDKSKHDLYSNVREVASYWKQECDMLREENHPLRWNELKLWVRENKPEGYELILNIMERLNKKEYIRGLRADDLLAVEISSDVVGY